MNRYRVRPFAFWNHDSTRVRGLTGRECAICKKLVREPFKHVAVVLDGGERWATQKDLDDPNTFRRSLKKY